MPDLEPLGWKNAQPLDTEKPYYTWFFNEETRMLTIYSECCGDTFSEDQERALYAELAAKYGG